GARGGGVERRADRGRASGGRERGGGDRGHDGGDPARHGAERPRLGDRQGGRARARLPLRRADDRAGDDRGGGRRRRGGGRARGRARVRPRAGDDDAARRRRLDRAGQHAWRRRLSGRAPSCSSPARPPATCTGRRWPARSARPRPAPGSTAWAAAACFVPPQVWAWRPWRVRLIRRVVSLVLAVFPFETALYRRAGVPVAFVGHPVLDALAAAPSRADARKELGVDGDAPVVGLLPGSRRHEVAGVLPTMRAAAGRIVAAHPDARFLVARAPTVDAAELGDEGVPPLRIVAGRTYTVMRAADLLLVTSGTA